MSEPPAATAEVKSCNHCGKLAAPGASRCEPCRLARNEREREAKRRKKEAATAAAAAAASKPEGEQKKLCNQCMKTLDMALFPVSKRNCDEGRRVGQCGPCHEKKLARGDVYNHSDKRKAAKARYRDGDAGKATKRRYRDGDAGKVANKRYRDGDAGKAKTKRGGKRRCRRMLMDPGLRNMNRIHVRACALVAGRTKWSPTFRRLTGRTESEFLRSVRSKVVPPMDWNVRSSFNLEHSIPQEAYDFTNPEDVRRAWSEANVRVTTPLENKQKGFTIIDELCMEVGTARFPVAWNGKLLTQAQKEVFYAQSRAPKVCDLNRKKVVKHAEKSGAVAASGDSSGDEDSEGESEDSEDESDDGSSSDEEPSGPRRERAPSSVARDEEDKWSDDDAEDETEAAAEEDGEPADEEQ
tara:strand:- start:169 stop:1398 length:1230 start_codon:yes stop_codon:yes gene_type:complete